MRHRTAILALAVAAALPIGALHAKEVRYPAARPRVSLDVPADWTVAETPLGLELQSPEKDSLVLACVTGGDRKSIDGWAKRALAEMTRQGVVFAKTGPATPAAGRTAEPTPGKPPVVAGAANPTASVAPPTLDRPYTFGGPPSSLLPPKGVSGDTQPIAGRAGDLDLQTLSNDAADPVTMKPSGHFLYTGGVLNGQPVDVELSVFPLDRTTRLLTEQQSGATDARAVMIVRSLRDLAK